MNGVHQISSIRIPKSFNRIAEATIAAWQQAAATNCLLQSLPFSHLASWCAGKTRFTFDAFKIFNYHTAHILQLDSLTWRFTCTCILLAAASGYVLLGALQVASANKRAPKTVAKPDDDARGVEEDNDDDEGDDDDDDDDDDDGGSTVPASGADQGPNAAAVKPQGGAGVADATSPHISATTRLPKQLAPLSVRALTSPFTASSLSWQPRNSGCWHRERLLLRQAILQACDKAHLHAPSSRITLLLLLPPLLLLHDLHQLVGALQNLHGHACGRCGCESMGALGCTRDNLKDNRDGCGQNTANA